MNDASIAEFEARTRRMRVLLNFLGHEYGPGEEADESAKSAYNNAVEATYHAIRQLALETCINCKPSLLNDLSKDCVTSRSQAAPVGHKPSE